MVSLWGGSWRLDWITRFEAEVGWLHHTYCGVMLEGLGWDGWMGVTDRFIDTATL